MSYIREAEIESALLEQLAALGYRSTTDAVIGPEGGAPEREAYSEVLLQGRLAAAVARLNPGLPAEARADAVRQVEATVSPSLVEENRRLHRLLVDGVPIEYLAEDGNLRGDQVRLIDFDDLEANDWLAVGQFTVVENGVQRRPDVVLFLNGLPVVVFELKNPGGEQATLDAAFNQLQTYKAQIPSLFRTNVALVISDGLTARIGSLTADTERFMPWRTTDGETIAPKGGAEQTVLVEGVCERGRFLALLRDFVVFGDNGGGPFKIIAGYHQFHAVRRAMRSTLRAIDVSVPDAAVAEEPEHYGLPSVRDYRPGDQRIGVIWHTQGSGKSLLMAFYAGQLVRSPALANPTILVITDRNDLDDQLFATFAQCAELIRQKPIQVESREDLRAQLDRASGGVIFTTMQKFAPPAGASTYPLLTDRRNVVVIADEAHRSQYGFKARVDRNSGEISYGFAKYLRDALPNASFVGFTGTPIDQADVNTRQVFGDYIDVYDISRAVEDGATVPIYYESRLARIELADDKRPTIDEEIEALTEDEAEQEQERIKRRWSRVEALVGAEQRLAMVAEDLVGHFEDRVAALAGKAMVVCMSRRICVALYDAIVALRPDWHADEDQQGRVKVVMTGSAADPEAWQPHIGTKARRDLIAQRAKDPDDPLQLVIVRDMWLTGFDAPAMHTMYIDKPMRGHGLMQAIARVNRVFRDKPAGLVVDYIGIAQNLKQALADYSAADQRQTGVDEAEAVAVLQEKFEVVDDMFHGFDYRRGLQGTPQTRLTVLAEAIDWILARQHREAEREQTDEARKRAHRRFQDATLALNKAFALAAASDYAREIRDAVGFFQTVRAALVKSGGHGGKNTAERDLAIAQIIDRAVVSTEIVDILAAAGLSTPDISILSDDFLAEVAQMEKKNLALEALRKLLADEVRARSRSNVVQGKQFSERLDEAIARYHTNAISTVEILQELIELAREIRAAKARGEEEGLSDDEIAFYDALAENQSAVEVMGNDQLKVIAHELLKGLRGKVTVDWAHRESARARIRVLVKRTLRRYGYPPDLQDAAVQTVLAQAEALSAKWVA